MSGTETVTYSYQESLMPGGLGFVIRSTDGATIPCHLGNTDYQAFKAWVAAGNTPPAGWTGP